MTIKHLISVGDSFMFGQDIVENEFRHELSDLTDDQLLRAAFYAETDHTSRYLDILNNVRFSSLLSKKFNLEHHDYSMGGSSMIGIKGQIYLALAELKSKGINTSECLFLIGLTDPERRLCPPSDLTDAPPIEKFPSYTDDVTYWKTYVSASILPNMSTKKAIDDYYHAAMHPDITPPGATQTMHSLNICDFASIMKAHGCEFCIMNIWGQINDCMLRHPDYEMLLDRLYSAAGVETIYPSFDWSFAQYFAHFYPETAYRFKGGHFNSAGHKRIAEFMEPVLMRKLNVS